MVPALLWVLTPALVDAMSAPAANGTAVTRGTPLPVWAPFDLQRSPNYELVYAVQAVTNVVINLTGLFLDIFFVTLMLHLTAELDVLNLNVASLCPSPVAPANSLESLDGDSLAEQTSTDAVYTARGDSFHVRTSTSRSHMYRLLVKNIQHHQMIIMCVDDLERVMGQSIFVILLTNVINICSQAFASAVLFRSGIDWGLVTKMLFTFVAYMFETGMFCMFGQAITDQSERLVESVGGCGWLEAEAGVRRALLVMLTQATRPLTVHVGKVAALSRSSFLQLLNMSYTVFNLLFELQSAD
ncbi:odorant receptor Or2-like [Schistocerca americana]|uniref:odorant receptor Or2-like n=1 Tax=Schistocerca americana TaxID=7009 RepID=UPI001F4F95E2|nr:odorant receptor Or2-like [Schistocerca americana]